MIHKFKVIPRIFSEFRLTAKVPFTMRFVFHNSIVLMGRSEPWILPLETPGGANQLSFKVLSHHDVYYPQIQYNTTAECGICFV